jgi:dihydrolipoamide dehydrogenase
MEKKVKVAIIGAGSSGLYALSQVQKVTDEYVLIDGGELGTTCARVGCMPSKALIQIADDFHRRNLFERNGIEGGDGLTIDQAEAMEQVRDLRDIFVDRVLAGSTDDMGEEFIEGNARFVEPNVLEVNGDRIRADRIIIAAGSRPVIPEQWQQFSDRILTSDNLFEQEELPESIAVIGLGVIGLELGQALHRIGVQVTGVDLLETIAGLEDSVVAETAIDIMRKEFPIWLGHPAHIEEEGDQLRVSAGDQSVVVDKLLLSMGRTPNVENLGLEKIGVPLDSDGIPEYNVNTMQVGDLPIFIAGDVTAERPILHEAGDEGRIAGYNAMHDPVVAFKRKTNLAITFCDPNIVMVGDSWLELDQEHIAIGEMRFGPVGRALIMGENKGILRLYADKNSGRLLGACIIGPKGENLGHLLAWSIQQKLSVADLIKMPFYHPTIEEGLQGALNDLRSKLDIQEPDLPELDRLA